MKADAEGRTRDSGWLRRGELGFASDGRGRPRIQTRWLRRQPPSLWKGATNSGAVAEGWESAKFKFQVVTEALGGEKTPGQIAKQYGVHPNSLAPWKKAFPGARARSVRRGRHSAAVPWPGPRAGERSYLATPTLIFRFQLNQ